MKNAVKLFFVAVVMVAFAACGGKTETTTNETQDTVKTEVVATPDTTQAADTTQAGQ
jgi:predicted small lipoprotein YifL